MPLLITEPSQLRRGDLMFGPIHHVTGLGIGAAQVVLAAAEPGLIVRLGVRKWWRYRHTGVVSEQGERPRLVQAMPGGAEEVDINAGRWTGEYVYLRPTYAPGQGDEIADAAQSFIGTPYDFLTYGAIPAYRRGVRTERIKQIISGTDTMMCSRLLDAACAQGRWHLFSDERLPGDVTPSEAFRRVVAMPLAAKSALRH